MPMRMIRVASSRKNESLFPHKTMNRIPLTVIALLLFLAVAAPAQTTQQTTPQKPVYGGPELVALMEKVMNYQLNDYGQTPNARWINWQAAPFWAGVLACYKATGDEAFYAAARHAAEASNWKVERRTFHADDMAVGQAYLEMYLKEKDPKMIEDVKSRIDQYFDKKKVTRNEVGRAGGSGGTDNSWDFSGRTVWWWCDALFMAPPVMARLYAATGDHKYIDLLNRMYFDTVDYLYDKEEGLFYRDDRFFFPAHQSPTGKKVFWSRGNGWVYAGLVRVLDYLPQDDPMRPRYLELYQQMTASLLKYQGEDGMWRSSLNDPTWAPVHESSGTGFFVYGLTAGVNRGWLDRGKYLPIALKGFAGLCSVMNPDGSIGFTQQVSDRPEAPTATSLKDYSQGAFLLSASEVYAAKVKPEEAP
jgi:rhamnogalacturonyl hydrolase YesR